MRRRATVVIAGAVLAAAGALAVVAVRGAEPPRTLQDRVRAVASTLRCPVCQDLSVADSPSSVARQMRAMIASELRAGRSPDEVRGGFVRAYGPWILLAPPRHGIDLVAWVAPILVVLAALLLAAVAVRRWTFGAPRPGGPGATVGGANEDPSAPRTTADEVALEPEDRRLLEHALASMDEDPD